MSGDRLGLQPPRPGDSIFELPFGEPVEIHRKDGPVLVCQIRRLLTSPAALVVTSDVAGEVLSASVVPWEQVVEIRQQVSLVGPRPRSANWARRLFEDGGV